MLYNIHYDICALIITGCILVLYHAKKQLPVFQNKVFALLLYTTFSSIICDLLCGVGLSYPMLVSRQYQIVTNTIYFLLRNLVVFFFVLYAISLTGKYKNIPTFIKYMIYIPLVIEFICIILTPKYQIVFRIDEQNCYVRSEGIYVLYLVAFYFLAFVGIFTYIYRRVIPVKTRRSIVCFIVLTMLPVIVQLMYPSIMVEGFGISICLLLTYLTVQKPEDLLDSETNLLNESAFLTMLPMDMAVNRKFYIITVIVDEFTSLNHMLGIFLIKTLMCKIADFLKLCAPKNMIYRIATHKFSIILDAREEKQIEEILEQIQQRFDKTWEYEGGQVKLPVKCCVIECPQEAKTTEQVLDYIETAELQKKIQTIVKVCDLENNYRKRMEDVKRAVRDALEYNHFEVYYQPIYSTKKQTVNSAEALLRLKDEKLGFVSPEEFIPLAEQTGDILKIGRFVFESVCQFMKEGKLEEKGIEYIEVNLSVIECMQDNLIGEFSTILKKYQIRPEQINLEITETAQAYSLEIFKDNIHEIKKHGFELSLDDYGTGYSTINYMISLPFRIIKIDKTIVWAAFEGERAAGLIENMIQMIRNLDMQIVAEGVETLEQAQALQQWGCEYLQGYYFSKPVPEQEFLEVLLEKKVVFE